jgi:hypothetical protein
MEMARNAWRYFEANWQQDTGLTNAVNAFPFDDPLGHRVLHGRHLLGEGWA